ncbi:ATP-binding protein [Actinomadura rugatobispora]|uniref:ATP-binding protein n=1 Tax=Actinomadura rugatobispora TaxID=1994 RepID=A0ABW1A5C2_9ACTN|nr:hypothetical protein GCM10010200_047380 [Actinomadura rugatobispora]
MQNPPADEYRPSDEPPPAGCAVWPLPVDGTCPREARAHVREALRALHVSDEMTDDACTIVSELASNAFVHALDGVVPVAGLPELWVYRRNSRAEVVTKVFDSAPWKGTLPLGRLRPPVGSERGRGFEIVDALTREHGGSWGVHRTRSRLGEMPVSGKVVYFTLPVPAAEGGVGRSCRAVVRELEAALALRGLGPLHGCEGWNMAVLSVRAEITVWARRDHVVLTTPQTGIRRFSLDDVVEIAEVIVQCGEELDAR